MQCPILWLPFTRVDTPHSATPSCSHRDHTLKWQIRKPEFVNTTTMSLLFKAHIVDYRRAPKSCIECLDASMVNSGLFLKSRTLCVIAWTAKALISIQNVFPSYDSLANSIPFFPRSNFTPCIPFPAKVATAATKFYFQLADTFSCRIITFKSCRCCHKFFWPGVGSISDGSTALRHWATFRSSGR